MKGTERWIGWRDDWDAAIGRGYGDDGTVCHDAGRLIAVPSSHVHPHNRDWSRALYVSPLLKNVQHHHLTARGIDAHG